MVINKLEKRKEPRLPIQLEGYLKKINDTKLKKCSIKNLSLHGSLILLDEPLKTNEHILIQIKNNDTHYELSGIVKWCCNGSLPYQTGVYFNETVDICIPLKNILSTLKKKESTPSRERYLFMPPSSNIYLDLIKSSSGQLYMGYVCLFFKNKIVNLFQSIITEINLFDVAIQNILKKNHKPEVNNIEDVSKFFYQHFKKLNNELNKIKIFIKTLSGETKEFNSINIIQLDKITSFIANNFYKKISSFTKIDFSANFSNNIPPFIGNKHILEKAIEMILTFNINYILFCHANKIKMYLTYIESKKIMLFKIINNGSKMFNKDLNINKNKLTTINFKNNFINYLLFVILILEAYSPDIKILNESGNNQFILSFSVAPIILNL